MTYPSGKVVAYGYDSQGRITAMTVDGAPLLSNIHYQPFGPATGWTFGNGNNYSRPLDSDGRIASYTLGSTINSLSYDPASRITTAGNQAFSYDTLNRLTGYTGTVSQTFSYDATGNRTLFTQDANSDSYTIDSTNNHLISINGLHNRSYTYTPSGNISADSLHSYNYDPRNRLSAVDFSTYSINGLGQRIKKTVPRPAPGGATTLISTLFVYDEQGQLIGEYNGNAATITETVYLGSQPVAALKPSATFYIHSDHLNTPRVITNSANIIIWRWNSDAFGSTTANEDPDANGARFNYNLRFPGQYFDQESGLHYNYFRDYDPVTGRYIESDPIGLNGGMNTYTYANGNPVMFIDPLGLACSCVYQAGIDKIDKHTETWFGQTREVKASYSCEDTEVAGSETSVWGTTIDWYLHDQDSDNGTEGVPIGTLFENEAHYNQYSNTFTYHQVAFDQSGYESFDPMDHDAPELIQWATNCGCNR